MLRSRILFLGAQPTFFSGLVDYLRAHAFLEWTQSSGATLNESAAQLAFDVVLIEHSEAQPSIWLEILETLRRAYLNIPVIIITSCGSEALAVKALRAGVHDYFAAPVSPEALLASVQQSPRYPRPAASPSPGTQRESDSSEMIGKSAALSEMRRYLERAAASDCAVLITGETGTGKELVAEFMHGHSKRGTKPFVCVNCAAIPESLLECELFGHTKGAFTGAESVRDGLLSSAEGGTIFLDEIGDMSLVAQAKILRVLEKKEVCRLGGTERKRLNIRFVAATNQDVGAMVNQGTFRKDLFFRLNIAQVHVPPLRDRTEDIPLLVDHFLKRVCSKSACTRPSLSEDCLRCLLHYEWPGNIRELKNVIEGLFLGEVTAQICTSQLPPHVRGNRSVVMDLGKNEKELLLSALFSANWNKSQAADKLHWSRMTLYRKIAKYNLSGENVGTSRKRPGQHDESV
jgi:DNA-binding NtrC family response regulator